MECWCMFQSEAWPVALYLLQMSHNYSIREGIYIKTANHSSSAIFWRIFQLFSFSSSMRSWSVDGGILLKTKTGLLEFLKSWRWNWKNYTKMSLLVQKSIQRNTLGSRTVPVVRIFKRSYGISVTSVISKKQAKKKQILAHLRQPSTDQML